MTNRRPSLVGLAICAYCAWQCRGLVGAWRYAPLDRLGWVAFLVWCAPIVWLRLARDQEGQPDDGTALLWVSLVCVCLGTLGSLNVITHVALAAGLVGLLPWSWTHAIWLGSAVSWMPAFGWLVGRQSPQHVFGARLLVVVPAVMMTLLLSRRSWRTQT